VDIRSAAKAINDEKKAAVWEAGISGNFAQKRCKRKRINENQGRVKRGRFKSGHNRSIRSVASG
jgi:hypothetical protein